MITSTLNSSVILVTGATGYIGSRLVARLSELGADVHIVHRPNSSLHNIASLTSTFTSHVHDGSIDCITKILLQVKPQVVFHLAALYITEHRPHDIESLINSNILFGTQLLEAVSTSECRNLVMAGTTWQHFSDDQSAPATLYAATKSALDVISGYYANACGLSVGSVLMSDTYGPHDPRKKLFWLIRQSSHSGEPLAMSAGDQILDLTYIDDAISALCAVADAISELKNENLQQYVVKPLVRYTLKEVVQTWERVTGKSAPIQWGKRPYRKREVMRPWQNGREIPGWVATVALEDGIRMMEHYHD